MFFFVCVCYECITLDCTGVSSLFAPRSVGVEASFRVSFWDSFDLFVFSVWIFVYPTLHIHTHIRSYNPPPTTHTNNPPPPHTLSTGARTARTGSTCINDKGMETMEKENIGRGERESEREKGKRCKKKTWERRKENEGGMSE